MNKLSALFKNLFLRVSLQEKIIFSRHLSMMIRAGVPLLEAVNMLQRQTKSRSLSKILKQTAIDLNNGQFLSMALGRHRSVFGDLFINIIEVGETSGILADNLDYLSRELSKKRELRRKVMSALIYPIIIIIATFGMTALLTIFIFPKILPVFASLNVDLPVTTRLLISVSNLLIERGILLVVIFIALIIAILLLTRIKIIKFFYHRLLLRLPVAGGMIKSVNMTNFSRTLGLLLKSGVKIVEAINITADTLNSLVYRRELREMAMQIQKGESISKHLAMESNLFPAMFANMVAVGESTGNLSETFLYLSEFYESEVGEGARNLSIILEPVLMLAMGVVVGFVALSIITPIYEVTQKFGR